jgi:hypothetical protein
MRVLSTLIVFLAKRAIAKVTTHALTSVRAGGVHAIGIFMAVGYNPWGRALIEIWACDTITRVTDIACARK